MKKELALVFLSICIVFYFALPYFGCRAVVANDFSFYSVTYETYRATHLGPFLVICTR